MITLEVKQELGSGESGESGKNSRACLDPGCVGAYSAYRLKWAHVWSREQFSQQLECEIKHTDGKMTAAVKVEKGG